MPPENVFKQHHTTHEKQQKHNPEKMGKGKTIIRPCHDVIKPNSSHNRQPWGGVKHNGFKYQSTTSNQTYRAGNYRAAGVATSLARNTNKNSYPKR